MRAKVAVLALTALLTVTGLGVSGPEASQYLGEVTWNAHDNEGHDFIVKAAISKVGGSYYEVQGQAPVTPGPGGVNGPRAVFSGGGVLVGTNLILTVAMTVGTGQVTEAMIMQINIEQSTFNGAFAIVTPVSYIPHGDPRLDSWSEPVPQGGFPTGHSIKSSLYELGPTPSSGTLTAAAPLPLGSGPPAVSSLLLDAY